MDSAYKDHLQSVAEEIGGPSYVQLTMLHKNIQKMLGVGSHNFAPFKDPNPACGPDLRYKALGGDRIRGLGDPREAISK